MAICKKCRKITQVSRLSSKDNIIICRLCRRRKCFYCKKPFGKGNKARKRGYHLRCKPKNKGIKEKC